MSYRSASHRLPLDGRLAVRCWCQMETVSVPAADVRRGLTGYCRLPACRETDRRARTAELERREELLRDW